MPVVEKIQIDLEANSDGFKKDLKQAELFARDTGKKLDPLLTKKLELEFGEAKVQLREVQESVRRARKEFDAGLISRKQLRDAEAGLKNVSSATTEAGRRLQNYRNTGDPALSRIQDKVNQLNGGFGKMKNFLLGVGSAIVSAFSVQKIQQFSDTFQSMQNQISQVAEGNDIKKIQNQLFDLANEARVPVDALTSSFVRFELVNRQIGGTTEETFQIIDTLSKGLINAGSSASEASSVMLQLAQAFGSGRLAGDEFRSVSENLPIILDILAKKLQVPRGELKELAAQGVITSDVLKDALIGANEDIDAAFGKTSATIGQTLTQATNRFLRKFGELDQTYGITEKLTDLINALADAILGVIEFTAKYGKALKELTVIIASLIGAKALLGFIKLIRLLPAALTTTTVATKALSVANTILAGTLVRLGIASTAALGPLAALAAAIYGVIYAYRELQDVQEINSQAEENRQNVTGSIADGITETARSIGKLRKENEELAKSGTKEAREQIKLNNQKLQVEEQSLKTQELILQRQRLNNQERYDEADALDDTINKNVAKTNQLREQFGLNKKNTDLQEAENEFAKQQLTTIGGLNSELTELKDKLEGLEIGSDEFNKVKNEIEGIENQLQSLNKTGGDLAKEQAKAQKELEKELEEQLKKSEEAEEKRNDRLIKNLDELEDKYDAVGDVFEDNIKKSENAIEKFSNEIKNTQEDIENIGKKSEDSANDFAKNFGGAESELRRQFERLEKLVGKNLDTFSGQEVFGQDEFGDDITVNRLRDFIEAKKEQLEIENELKEAQSTLEQLQEDKVNEEKILQDFTDAKIKLEENYKNKYEEIAKNITEIQVFEDNLRIQSLEKVRQKALATAAALREAGQGTSSSINGSNSSNTDNSRNTTIGTINVTDNTAVESLERTLNTNIQ